MRILIVFSFLLYFSFCNSIDGANINTDIDHSNASTEIVTEKDKDTLFAHQLRHVIASIPTRFESLKGTKLILEDGEIAYQSTITFEQTLNNIIGDIDGRRYYMAKIAEDLHEDKAKQLVSDWKAKVEECLNIPAGKQIPYRTGGPNSELKDGTLFLIDKQHGVSVYWVNGVDSELYEVVIAII